MIPANNDSHMDDYSIVTTTYSINRQNKVRQLKAKARYDKDTVEGILDAGLVAHVAFNQEGSPVVVPMIYGREGDTIYLHGARKARIVRMLEQTDTVCLNVTLLDAVVLARSAFNSSMNYRSVTIFGKPRLLQAAEDKIEAMRVISEHMMPGRWSELREPHEREVTMTGVIAMTIETASAKISAGMPDDDADDYDIPVWAGILPLTSKLGTLQPDDRLQDGVEPSAAVRSLQHRSL